MTMCSRHDITEIRLNVALNTNQSIIYVLYFRCTMERVCFVYLEVLTTIQFILLKMQFCHLTANISSSSFPP